MLDGQRCTEQGLEHCMAWDGCPEGLELAEELPNKDIYPSSGLLIHPKETGWASNILPVHHMTQTVLGSKKASITIKLQLYGGFIG